MTATGRPPPLRCYLLRDDGEWYDLGEHHRWGTAFETFPGPPDGSVNLSHADVDALAVKLEGDYEEFDTAACARIALDIVCWSQRVPAPRHWATNPAHSIRFLTELDHQVQVDRDVRPSPITGSIAGALAAQRSELLSDP